MLYLENIIKQKKISNENNLVEKNYLYLLKNLGIKKTTINQ